MLSFGLLHELLSAAMPLAARLKAGLHELLRLVCYTFGTQLGVGLHELLGVVGTASE